MIYILFIKLLEMPKGIRDMDPSSTCSSRGTSNNESFDLGVKSFNISRAYKAGHLMNKISCHCDRFNLSASYNASRNYLIIFQ